MANRQPWDFRRFCKTLAYFRVIPFIGALSAWQPGTPPPTQQGIVLVVGATGGVGKRVVKTLQQRGYRVRALVRDSKRGKAILGNSVEIVEADLTIPGTLTPQVTDNVTAVICCSGTRVQPVGGDTPNREKYYQGVKFYLPEVVDVPEQVEYEGIKNLVTALNSSLKQTQTEPVIFDFINPSKDVKETWGVLDDIVMGGVSESSIRLIDSTALFTGVVSTANSGGFVSVRTRNLEPPLNLSDCEGIQLRVKGDGKRYKFIVRNQAKWDGIGYCYSFDTVYNIWTTVQIPFRELIPVFRAKTLRDHPPFDPSQIFSVQLMLSKFEYDGNLNPKFSPGTFQLQVESIKGYGAGELPRFVLISSAGVTRPGRPGLNLEAEPPAVRLNDQLGGILTWKLQGENVIRQSGIPYTILRPCALTEAKGGEPLIGDQGDEIKGQVSREDIAELAVQCLSQTAAKNITVEVKAGDTTTGTRNWSTFFSNLTPDTSVIV